MGAQIKKEISIMKSVAHPHVVAIREVFATTSKIFIVLELVEGGELFEYLLDRKRLPEAEARHFMLQLVEGLTYCHSNGIFHRDLKPENLLLDLHGNIKISDFGLSTLYVGSAEGSGGNDRMELLHTTCGTPNYVAPEVLENRGYDGRNADVWSLGIILFVLVAGYLPFEEDTMPGLFDKIKRADFAMPSCSDGVGVSVEPSLEPSSPSRRNPYARARSCSPQKDSSSVRFSADLIELLENILVADPRRRWTLQQVRNSAWMKGKTTAPTRIKNTAQLSISPARVPSAAKRKNSETQDDENSDPNQRRLSRGRISSNPLHTRGSKSLSMPLASLESAEKRKASKVEETASLVGPTPAAPAEAVMKCVVTTQVVVQLEESALQSESMPPVNACCIMS